MPNTDIELLLEAVESVPPPQLYSIFDRISYKSNQPSQKRNPLAATILTEQNIVKGQGNLTAEPLRSDLALLSNLHPSAQTDTFFYLLQKYGWRIGMPNVESSERQDVAFCDALRVERALESKGDKGGYLLLKGDLSGIQEYIYSNIQQKTAGGLAKLAKRLRGRSIIVTLLTDFLAGVALRELGLPVWNLLFAGGGHFNLLLPDNPKMRVDLDELIARFDDEMRQAFGDRLNLILAYVECSEKQITEQAGTCFMRLNAERERKKYQQHKGELSSHFYPAETPLTPEQKNEQDEKEIGIGQSFPKQRILVEAVGGRFRSNKGTLELVTLKMSKQIYSLLAFENIKDAEAALENAAGLVSAQIFTLNDTDFYPKKSEWSGKVQQPVSFGFRFLGKYAPTAQYKHPKTGEIESRPQTFEELTRGLADGDPETNAPKVSLEMLGAIRLDVDDLGFIFSQGMHEPTLGRIITLSREMHYFFSAHFDQLAQQHQLYLIYSGGDDAFAVGQWKNLIDFARHLHLDFQSFVSNNKNVHFSAGVFLGNPKYPVGRFYLDADELLNAAKDNDDKNRVHIFHRVIRWDAFDKKIKFGADFSEMLKKGSDAETRKLSMAFTYRLLTLVKTSFYERTEIENGKIVKRGSLNPRRFAQNISRMRYLFARNGYDNAKTAALIDGVEKELTNDFLRNFKFGTNNEQSIQDNLVALNYALYTIRSQKNTEQ